MVYLRILAIEPQNHKISFSWKLPFLPLQIGNMLNICREQLKTNITKQYQIALKAFIKWIKKDTKYLL